MFLYIQFCNFYYLNLLILIQFSRQDGPEDITHGKILADSEDSECSSTSDINSDDLLDTPNTSGMKSSDDVSTLSTSSCSSLSVRLFYSNL